MTHGRRWVVIATVVVVLTLLAIVLYLMLEPQHRDDNDVGVRTVLLAMSGFPPSAASDLEH